MSDKLPSRMEWNLIHLRPVLQHRKVRNNNRARKLAPVAEHGSVRYEHVIFQAILNRLGSDEFSAAGLEQILLAVRNFQEAVRVNVPDVSGFEPLPFKRLLGLLWI